MTAKANAQGCPKCPHCQAEAQRALGTVPAASALSNATRRPWQQPHYGEKITSIVDWFDGNWIGSRAKSKAEAIVPAQIKDPQAWLEGFAEGWEDAERYREIARSWHREKVAGGA